MTRSPETETNGKLSDRAVVAVMWTAAQKWAVRVTAFVTIAILTRVLAPEDFGTVAVATAVLPVAYLLADMGFSTYVIQAPDTSPRALSTAFWFSATAGAVLTAALVLVAPLLAAMFHVPAAIPVIRALAFAVLFVTFSTVPTALLKREMKFKRLAVQSVIASIAGQAIAVVFALSGLGVWALVAQMVLYQAVAAVLVWFSARWVPRFSFSVRELRAMAAFGAKVVGVDLIALLRGWAETAIIAAALGVTGLGYATVAQRLMQIAQDVTAAAVLPVSTVVFSQIRSTSDRLRAGYLRALGLSFAVIVPVMVFLSAAAPALLPLLFGDKWGPSIIPNQVLAIVGIFTLGAMLDHGLFYGGGRPGIWLVYGVAIDGLTVLAALIFAPHGIVAWSTGFLLVALLATVARWPLVGKLVGAKWYVIAARLGRSLLAGALAAAAGFTASWATASLSQVVSVFATGVAVVLVQLGAMQIVMRGEWRDGLRLAGAQLTKLKPRGRAAPLRGTTAVQSAEIRASTHDD